MGKRFAGSESGSAARMPPSRPAKAKGQPPGGLWKRPTRGAGHQHRHRRPWGTARLGVGQCAARLPV